MAEYPSIAGVTAPYPAGGQNGAISGGVLRPGSIDQSQFQQLLQAQYQQQNQGKVAAAPAGLTLADYRKLAGSSGGAAPIGTPAAPAPQPSVAASRAAAPSDGVPTLTLAQFAALTGISPPEAPAAVPAADPLIPGNPGGIQLASGTVEPVAEMADGMPAVAEPEEPAKAPQVAELTDGVPVESEPTESADAQPTDPRVVMLDHYPDREEQRSLSAQGKTWHMKETPGARELFLGPDGKFGWDDFVDIINPLQHIPVVAQIYRAVTGDQAYGLSAFVGALPFGPISVASAVVDTMVRSQTGRDAGTDLAARIFGIDNRTPEEADLNLGRTDGGQLASAESGSTTQTADAAIAQYQQPATSWTRDMSGGRG
nr:hypothetical protein [uncultured Dongia sp.]